MGAYGYILTAALVIGLISLALTVLLKRGGSR